MRDTHCVDETSADVEKLSRVLIEMLEAKDWYTGRNHSQSVGSLSTRIGKTLLAQGIGSQDPTSLDWLDLPTLHLGGQLHDVGKLAVPWSLLNKISPLTPDELDNVRAHAALGEQILNELGLHRAARIAGQHHERCDGKGYPRGIRDITLMGAIAAVADAFEAMTTANRRYRAKMNRDEGVQELVRCRGTVFDPRVVDAMVSIFTRPPR